MTSLEGSMIEEKFIAIEDCPAQVFHGFALVFCLLKIGQGDALFLLVGKAGIGREVEMFHNLEEWFLG